ncbi:MAG: glutaredoxin family protein [Spirochaetes bacterium]|nr:glutaredoxin family protein [Spirochaetota bacterium]
MLESLEYTQVDGEKVDHDVVIYALSTCGFCKRAMAFLDANTIRYRYVYLDRIPIEAKNEAKRTLKERHGMDVAFPFAVIDGTKNLVGFIEPDWKSTLGL